jgi:hypothetical protein
MPQGPQSVNAWGGGVNSLLHITGTAVVKAGPGKLHNFILQAAGTAGSWTINDCAAVGSAGTANQIALLPFNATNLIAGEPLQFNWPCKVGIVVSTVPTGGGVGAISFD